MIVDEYLNIKIGSKQLQYYRDLGYNVNVGDMCLVKNEDAVDGSSVIETRICDICKQKYEKPHVRHVKTYNRFNMDVCPNCVKTNENIKMLTKERRATTLLQNYGVDNPSKSELVKEKKIKTLIKNYGVENPMQSKEIQDKAKSTNIEKYGVDVPAKSLVVREKTKSTCLKKYGVEYTSQIPESRIKTNESYYKHGSQKVSSQQKKIFDMLKDDGYNVILNYPLSSLSLDICLIVDDIKIDIEYDGSYWHQDEQKDRRRDEFVKSQGYKVLRICSDKKVPTLEQLKNEINYLIQSTYKFHKFEI